MLAGAAAVLVAVVAAATVGTWLYLQPPAWAGPRITMAVLPLRDRTGEADGEVRALLVADLLSVDLGSSRIVRVLDPDQVRSVIGEIPGEASEEELRARLVRGASVDYVAQGTLYREDGRLVATLDAVASDGESPELSVHASGADAAAVADRLASNLRRVLPGVSALTARRDDRADLDELTSSSEEARLLYERGRMALRDGHLEEAVARLEAAVGVDPDFLLARATLAEALHLVGYVRRSREEADWARDGVPAGGAPAAARLALHVEMVWAGVFERADELLDATSRFAARFPDEPGARIAHGQALKRAGRTDEALDVLGSAVGLDPTRPASHLVRAEIAIHAGEHDLAREALGRADELYRLVGNETAASIVAISRGKLLASEGRFGEAATVLRDVPDRLRAAGRELGAAEAAVVLARVHLSRGDLAGAETALREAVASASSRGALRVEATARGRLGAIRYAQGRLDEAEAELREAVDIARRLQNDLLMSDPLFNLASMLLYYNEIDEAERYLPEVESVAEALGTDFRPAEAKLFRADFEAQRGRLDAALASYDAVLSTEGMAADRRVWALLGKAEILEQQGRLADAIAACDQVPRRTPDATQPIYSRVTRARVEAALGRIEAAASSLDAAKEHWSTMPGHAAPGPALAAARARLHLATGDWRDAHATAAKALEDPETRKRPVMVAELETLACRAALARSRADEALAHCRAASAVENAPAAEATRAEVGLAAALLRSGDAEGARVRARSALGSATEQGIDLAVARAAAVLARALDRGDPERGEAVSRGREALGRYLDAAPAADRPAVRTLPDIAGLEEALRAEGEEAG
jgi:tetratricopeptide (TPR) repeat protein